MSDAPDFTHACADTALILRRRFGADTPNASMVLPSLEVASQAWSTPKAASPGAENDLPPTQPESESIPPVIWGLALSGGGIRSATLSLGVLQAVAAASALEPIATMGGGLPPGLFADSLRVPLPPLPPEPNPTDALPPAPPPGSLFRSSLLSCFDYLSTVSGGGYTGAFLCSLFLPGRLRESCRTPEAAADDAVRVLCHQPPGRLGGGRGFDDARLHEAPLAWLRDNGRYLAPTGGGDMLYVGSLALRNWIALHYVIGCLLLGAFALMAALETYLPFWREYDQRAFDRAGAGIAWSERIWWSPQLWVPFGVLVFFAGPIGMAFWLPTAEGRDDGRCGIFNRACCGYMMLITLFVLAAIWTPTSDPSLVIWQFAVVTTILGLAIYLVNRCFTDDVETLRVRLTRQLTGALTAMAALTALGLIDTIAHTVYLRLVFDVSHPAQMLVPAGLGAIWVWIVQRVAKSADGFKPPVWLKRLPWNVLGGMAGIAIFALTATAWALAVVWYQWQGLPPYLALPELGQVRGKLDLCALGVAAMVLAVINGQFPSFINLSSLQSLYGARLTRAYLGASNGERFKSARPPGTRSVADPRPRDEVQLAQYLCPGHTPALSTLAPLHLINVSMNKTVDPGEQLVQRDRKGQPLLVTPLGFAVDGEFRRFPTATPRYEIQRTLSVGQWIGTSGAAFSTAIGRHTSLGLSLLLGAANVRLGTWWESGAGIDSPVGLFRRVVRKMFKTQTYLLDEFTAKFRGLCRRWQYLSDGGHFENTGLYELLRPKRGVSFAIACDNGADPDFQFGDLANLIRLLRIDLGVELEVDSTVRDDPILRQWIGVPEDFRRDLPHMAFAAAADLPQAFAHASAPPPAPVNEEAPQPIALLLRARPGGQTRPSCWVLLLKPRVRRDAVADVVEYALGHPKFPQEPTADQFFDEAQWESYRKLGHDNAAALLQPTVWHALHAHIAAAHLELEP